MRLMLGTKEYPSLLVNVEQEHGENHFGLLKAGENMSDKGYSIGTKEGYDAFVEKRSAGNRSEPLE